LKDMYGSADVSLIRDANNNGRVDSGEVLASSEGSSNKLISGNLLDNLSAGTYYVRVKGNTSYGLAVNLDQAGNSRSEGNPGGFSINKARNLGTLSDIAPSQDYQFSDFVGSSLGDPVDFYSFRLDKPRSLSFALRDMTGNANVYIEDGNGTVLAKSENGGSADELGSVNLAGSTNYYVRVAPVGSESTNYRLVLNPGTPLRTGYYRELSSLSETQWDQQSGDNNQFEQYPLGGGGDQRGKTDDRIEQIYTDLSKTIFGYRVPMTAGYAYDQSYYSGYGTWHAGLDMGANNGATIKAAIGGRVTWTSGSGDGNIFVGINSDDGRQWVYGHLKSASGLSNGKRINAGETVGIVGAQNHLHLEVENGQAYGGTQGSMTNRGTLLGVTVSPLMAYWQWRNR
jgi:murein DD-endopeptidase MepM/ murein hydrolase activator NlpD